MWGYIIKRVIWSIPTLFLSTVMVFAIMRLLPGDPAQLLAGEVPNPELLAAIRQEMGLDKPVIVQYANWLWDILRLDFGSSIVTKEPVLDLIIRHFSVTSQIVLVAIVFVAAVALSLGMTAAYFHNSKIDLFIVSSATFLMALPVFWLGILVVLLFSISLQWLPSVGFISIFEDFSSGIKFLVLPVLVIVLTESGAILRMVRSTVIDQLRLEYVEHARVKGVREKKILFRHVLPNAIGPVLTLLGLVLGALLGSAAVIETVFTIPGLGRLLVMSISARDYVMVQGIMIFTVTLYVVINMVVDLIRALVDPRTVL